ncbi:zinc finger BED domain-containing protein 1-like [Astyanax mexicanus]|uniref:Zinc finger BED domain-containing protein 1-like n=1 Tax=Astyanax mexicanus TaxID=7994 RepID=A0A8T2M1G8_ASTMX|nr:zinc finger BED domain-containing protein 1-like [Astyanax mexicanus]
MAEPVDGTQVSAVENALKTGEYSTIKPTAGKSDVWQSFSIVINGDRNRLPFACCDKCNKVFVYSSHKSGTSGLKRHRCTALKGQTKLSFTSTTKVTNNLKKETTEKCVQFVCKDIRPFDTVSGQGFSKLAQHLVDTAAKIGKFDVKEMLPHPTTISRHIEEEAIQQKRSLVDIMTETISKYGCAVTTDIWTENYRKTSFLSATIHYIDDSYNLVSRVSLLFQNLRVFGIDCTCTNMVNKIVFVTDRGANMVSSLRDFTRINCSAHILNVILSSAFATAVMENACEVSQLITDETRWNSVFDMTDSVLQQFEEISTILLENNQYGKIGCINKNMLTTVVSFLKPFKDATNDLESDSSTLSGSLVLPWSVKLMMHCTDAVAIPALTEVASVCVRRLNELMSTDNSAPNAVHRLYRVATFLTPKLRHLKMLDNYARADVMNAVKELIANLMFESKNDEPQPPAKRDKGSMAKDGTTTAESEINDYLSVKLDTTEESGSHQVLQWWKNHRLEFPSLSKLARHVLCIPASSAPSERAFSVCGRILEERRSVLKPSTVSNILFLHGNLK